MKEIEFKELKVNDKFTLNGTEYIKIQDKRISCCKVLNAVNASQSTEAIQVKPLTVVQVND